MEWAILCVSGFSFWVDRTYVFPDIFFLGDRTYVIPDIFLKGTVCVFTEMDWT